MFVEDFVELDLPFQEVRRRLSEGAERWLATATDLQFLGYYDPPGGPVGRVIDRVAMHHLAEACVRSFLHRVGDGLLGVTTRAGPWPLPGR